MSQAKLKIIRNFREIKPRNSCANCKHNVIDSTNTYRTCELADGDIPWGETEYMYHFYCDSYKHENKLGLELG
ncbi:hypothetical protein Kuja_1650 [Vibrio phage vB_VchM_Kuja]|uniref:Uncharacterized protein n=1 Tax=Vibrio phage vB_VchM_Kuja TaxID=2686437 RepID=A0A6B9JI02_9CAUD|nr:hypothetical protein HWC83_gp070 [Vibrio phage vB_VchM_Kuja]QGZ16157.1 hypothetical protein Kuja_1650 [Vibrio phage vB_VchM_Kuja]